MRQASHVALTATIHNFDSCDRKLVVSFVERLDRRTGMTVSVADRHLWVALDGVVREGELMGHT
jgi:hypothetical protein